MKFVATRLVQMVLVVVAVTFLAFGAMNFLGDPLFNILGPIASEDAGPEFAEIRAEARAEYYLDDPFVVRYGRWLGDIVQGDFGRSFKNETNVSTDLKNKLPITIFLMVYAQVIAVVISIPWALWSASKAYRAVDKASTVISFSMLGVPVFALAVLLFWIFAVKWQVFPTRYDDTDFFSKLNSMFLAALTLAVPLIATYQRLLRTDLISTLQEDFIAVARAKGLPQWWVLFRHALRPSMFSMLTVFGIQTGALIGGSLIVEQQFSIPGIGAAVVEAIIRDDFPVVLAIVVIVSVIFVVVNFLVDLLYSFLDPRVRLDG
ncbi:MAG: ABC transporter permease [Acidimicrobiia bacterium]|nr:ABC transporter permease [Acidimicrobiia bacterium]